MRHWTAGNNDMNLKLRSVKLSDHILFSWTTNKDCFPLHKFSDLTSRPAAQNHREADRTGLHPED